MSEFVQQFQSVLMVACGIALAVCLFCLFLFAAAPTVCDAVRRFLSLSAVQRIVVAIVIVGFAQYGATKGLGRVRNEGSDEGLQVVGVYTGATNIVDAVSGETNRYTAVEVWYLGSGVTTTTPVSVRDAIDEDWTELAKTDAGYGTEGTTNKMTFIAAGDYASKMFWWIGTDTPAKIVESVGITITEFTVASKFVKISWTCDTPGISTFTVQRRLAGTQAWESVATTSDSTFIYMGFTVDRTWEWRVVEGDME